ncbi:hypothetical protein Q8F55_008524 [Vanrija albida]|uniref:RanBP2-type domain-containing protein n=1 Tax=Vanrija albida TaxID=181172 RepID=A0ABR3PRC8_9TREE
MTDAASRAPPSNILSGVAFHVFKHNRTVESVRETEAILVLNGGVVIGCPTYADYTIVELDNPEEYASITVAPDYLPPQDVQVRDGDFDFLAGAARFGFLGESDLRKIVQFKFIESWILLGDLDETEAARWTVSVRTAAPQREVTSPAPSNKTVGQTGPHACSAKPVELEKQKNTTPTTPKVVHSDLHLPQVFANIGPCSFFVTDGCSKAVTGLVKNMGGTLEESTRALIILVKRKDNGSLPSAGSFGIRRLHPLAKVMDQQFVFDCLKNEIFEDLAQYTIAQVLQPTIASTLPSSSSSNSKSHVADTAEPGSSSGSSTRALRFGNGGSGDGHRHTPAGTAPAAPPAPTWDCQTCMLPNPNSVTSCTFCESPRSFPSTAYKRGREDDGRPESSSSKVRRL